MNAIALEAIQSFLTVDYAKTVSYERFRANILTQENIFRLGSVEKRLFKNIKQLPIESRAFL